MIVFGFYTNRSLAGKEIRFTPAPNAFSSLAYVVAGNGCRPSFTEIPYLPLIGRNPPVCGLQASFRGAKLELQHRSLTQQLAAGSFNN
jgi:hypothetical protein